MLEKSDYILLREYFGEYYIGGSYARYICAKSFHLKLEPNTGHDIDVYTTWNSSTKALYEYLTEVVFPGAEITVPTGTNEGKYKMPEVRKSLVVKTVEGIEYNFVILRELPKLEEFISDRYQASELSQCALSPAGCKEGGVDMAYSNFFRKATEGKELVTINVNKATEEHIAKLIGYCVKYKIPYRVSKNTELPEDIRVGV